MGKAINGIGITGLALIIAMFGYGGLCAKIIQGGAIECGAAVRLEQD